jgi:hypothetical protein
MRLIVDINSQVSELLAADQLFTNIRDVVIDWSAWYVVGRRQFLDHYKYIVELIDQGLRVVLSNPREGADTFEELLDWTRTRELATQGRMYCISGSLANPNIKNLDFDIFLSVILDPPENILAQQRSLEIYTPNNKPYKFLFFNGRMRPHRKYLLESFRTSGLLNSSLYTCLDTRNPRVTNLQLLINDHDLLTTSHAIHLLPKKYELSIAQEQLNIPTTHDYVHQHLFGNVWGDGLLKAEPYIDSYFSLVTETLFESNYSFRTEKIWKPIAMAHPFIVASTPGYYRDLHNLGFKTFGHLVDERFDQIDNHQQRIERIAQVVEDLCKQDLPAFLQEAESICKYNQQHLLVMRDRVRTEFPKRFSHFITHYE